MSRAEREKKYARRKAELKAAGAALWREVRRKHNLSDEDIRQAKELGFGPERILRLDPRPKEKWKLPPKQWINSLYRKKTARIEKKRRSKEKWLSKNKQIT